MSVSMLLVCNLSNVNNECMYVCMSVFMCVCRHDTCLCCVVVSVM